MPNLYFIYKNSKLWVRTREKEKKTELTCLAGTSKSKLTDAYLYIMPLNIQNNNFVQAIYLYIICL
jgi:hypothetical protein